MTSRQAQQLFFQLSADSLSPEVAEAVRQRIAECPDCQGEWVLLERTLLTLSTTPQPITTETQSHEMWLVCMNRLQTEQSDSHADQRATLPTHADGVAAQSTPRVARLRGKHDEARQRGYAS